MENQNMFQSLNENYKPNQDICCWLRDHCPCQQCYHHSSGQRLDIFNRRRNLLIHDSITYQTIHMDSLQHSLTIVWQDNHVSTFDQKWLEQYLPHFSSTTTTKTSNIVNSHETITFPTTILLTRMSWFYYISIDSLYTYYSV